MSRTSWSGRKVRVLVDLTLANKGTTCHLCQLPGADSADHDPPRSQLLRSGVPDPDAIGYLWPAHKLCNLRRQDRPITEQLRAELHRRRLADLVLVEAAASRSPRFIKAPFLRAPHRPGSAASSPYISRAPRKNLERR